MASACAVMVAAVGFRRTKLQLLHPIAGVRDCPLSAAIAAGEASRHVTPTTAVAAATARAERVVRRARTFLIRSIRSSGTYIGKRVAPLAAGCGETRQRPA